MIRTATANLPRDILAQHITRILIEDTDFENASILLYDKEHDCLRLNKATGFLDVLGDNIEIDYNKDLVFQRDEGIAWRVFKYQTPFFIEDCESQPLPNKKGAKINPGSFVCLPLGDQGVINMSASRKRMLPEIKRRCLIILADLAGHLLRQADLQDHLNSGHLNLQQLIEAGIIGHGADAWLKESASYLESVMQYIPQGICIININGDIVYANQRLLNMLDSEINHLRNQPISKIVVDAAGFDEVFKHVLYKREITRASDVHLAKADGSALPVEIFLHPLKGRGGHIDGVMLVIYDPSTRQSISEDLLRDEKLKAIGTMAGGIAHNFNNLLTAILGNTELLARGITDPIALKRIKNIERAVLDGAQMIRRLQTFTRFNALKQENYAPTDVKTAIEDAIELTSPRWKDICQRKGIQINLIKQLDDTGPVSIQQSELREVLINMIFNAIEAMPDGGDITLRTYQHGSTAFLEIEDTGSGMSDDIKRQVFDPFFSTKGVENSGLGLSISYGLIVGSGGDIRVKSQPGKGTTFILSLPVVKHHQPDAANKEGLAAINALRILVVDDEAPLVDLLSVMLKDMNHIVTGTSSGEKALSLIETERFDLIITDLGMPLVNGWQIAAAAHAKSPPVPVILLTGWGCDYDGKDLKARGIAAVLCKPFKLDGLICTISEVVNQS
ncbi:MAG: ATP-binding protein [Dissulfurimicrobium hydrothermale]|uniref:hybrid sensor histidine kinase/response regulator n=1 Tax=Dissulfurimicrobium hydrothermale TaxID=1750598 RepID=UPI003C79524B